MTPHSRRDTRFLHEGRPLPPQPGPRRRWTRSLVTLGRDTVRDGPETPTLILCQGQDSWTSDHLTCPRPNCILDGPSPTTNSICRTYSPLGLHLSPPPITLVRGLSCPTSISKLSNYLPLRFTSPLVPVTVSLPSDVSSTHSHFIPSSRYRRTSISLSFYSPLGPRMSTVTTSRGT